MLFQSLVTPLYNIVKVFTPWCFWASLSFHLNANGGLVLIIHCLLHLGQVKIQIEGQFPIQWVIFGEGKVLCYCLPRPKVLKIALANSGFEYEIAKNIIKSDLTQKLDVFILGIWDIMKKILLWPISRVFFLIMFHQNFASTLQHRTWRKFHLQVIFSFPNEWFQRSEITPTSNVSLSNFNFNPVIAPFK